MPLDCTAAPEPVTGIRLKFSGAILETYHFSLDIQSVHWFFVTEDEEEEEVSMVKCFFAPQSVCTLIFIDMVIVLTHRLILCFRIISRIRFTCTETVCTFI